LDFRNRTSSPRQEARQLHRAVLKEENIMRKIGLILFALITLALSAWAETITTTVNGMVCAFCATGIEKTFHKQPEVALVKVDLPKKQVVIKTKPGQTLSDARIKEVVTYSGYTMGKIQRTP
jgi:copper chaperone CopZ